MIRLYSALIGIGSFLVGVLSLALDDSIPEENQIEFHYSLMMIITGIFLIYYGRRYLLNWLFYLLSGDDD